MPLSPAEITELYNTYFDTVYKYVYYRVRNVQVAEDIVSEVFMKVVKKQEQYTAQAGATVRSWLFSIVRSTIADYYRKQGAAKRQQVELIDRHDPNYDAAIDDKMQLQQIIEALETLSDQQREIVLLRYQSDMKNTEIAELLQIKPKSVSAALAKALTKLRTTLV